MQPATRIAMSGEEVPGRSAARRMAPSRARHVEAGVDCQVFAKRLACIDLPALPLQLLLRREPTWRRQPVAVVDVDRPQGKIEWINECAYRAGVRVGWRYAEGLSLCAGLRAGVVERPDIAAAIESVIALLRRFSPRIEPDSSEPGILRVDLTGLGGVFESPKRWAEELSSALRASGWHTILVIGFDKFRAYALAKSLASVGQDLYVCEDRDDEMMRTDGVALARLRIDPTLRDVLDRLGLTDVGDLRSLPRGGLLARFGEEGAQLQRLAEDGGGVEALQSVEEQPRFKADFELDPEQPSIDRDGLLFMVKQRLDSLIAMLAARGEAVGSLRLLLHLDPSARRDSIRTALQPAEPTLESVQLVDLIRLRLEMVVLDASVVGFELEVEPAPASRSQLQLFGEETARDLRAANRALARLRAELGNHAVMRARLRPGHMPEAMFVCEPFEHLDRIWQKRPARDRLPFADMTADKQMHCDQEVPGALVRRFLANPQPTNSPDIDPDGWFVGGLDAGTVRHLVGPYVISGGWWRPPDPETGTGEIHREYYFAETDRGDVLWVYRDKLRRRWFLQGVVD